jgi:hypothetical protein
MRKLTATVLIVRACPYNLSLASIYNLVKYLIRGQRACSIKSLVQLFHLNSFGG